MDDARLRPTRLTEPVIVGIVYVAAMFVNILDTTIVNVALPTLATQFKVPVASSEWVVTGYLLSLAVWIPASGWIGDKFGTKRIFLVALALFTTASVLCGLATSLPELIVFRIVQGVGGGMLTPIGLAMLYRAFPPERRAAASRILIIPTALAPAMGPVIGGLLIDQLSWRWVFFVNVPIGIAAFVFGALKLREYREPTAYRFDFPGFLLAAAGLGLLMYALSEGPADGWLSPAVVTTAGIGLVSMAGLVFVELRSSRPMLQLRLFTNRLFARTNLTSMFATAAFTGTLFIVPIMLQRARGASAFESGLTTFPEAIGVLSVSQIAARLYPRLGPSRLMTAGMVAMSAVLFVFSWVDASTSEWSIRGLVYLLGASYSFMIIALQASSFAGISHGDTARASALYNTQRQVASALGVAILASGLAAFLPHGQATSAQTFLAYQRVFMIAAFVAALGAVVSRFVPDKDAAATMVPRVRRGARAAHSTTAQAVE
ncbi:MAG: MDR family MFS transporter [Ilumatobacteraceae bacterium]